MVQTKNKNAENVSVITQQTQVAEQPLKKQVPIVVKIISVLNYIGCGVLVLCAIFSFVGAGIISSFLGFLGGFVIILGIIFLALAVLVFFIARGLWKGQNWARIITIIFAILGFLSAIYVLVDGLIANGIVNLIVEGFIAGYLIFSKEVKEAFK